MRSSGNVLFFGQLTIHFVVDHWTVYFGVGVVQGLFVCFTLYVIFHNKKGKKNVCYINECSLNLHHSIYFGPFLSADSSVGKNQPFSWPGLPFMFLHHLPASFQHRASVKSSLCFLLPFFGCFYSTACLSFISTILLQLLLLWSPVIWLLKSVADC